MNIYAIEQLKSIYKSFMVEGARFYPKFDISECSCTAKSVPSRLIDYKAKEGATGFEGIDHWHIYNPFTKGKIDTYLDKDGNPVKNGSDPLHIIPKKNGDDQIDTC